MTDEGGSSSDLEELRRRAEAAISEEASDSSEMSADDAKFMVHELRTHQIELEMQNEELRRAQQELQDAHSLYVDLYDFAPVGYLTLNEKGMIVEANLTAADLLGKERSHLIGQFLSAFIDDDDDVAVYYKHRRVLLAEEEMQTSELRMKKCSDGQFWARITSAIRTSAESGEKNIRVIISDIAELKIAEKKSDELQEKLSRSERMASLSILAGGVAHDLNNSLGPLVALPDLIRQEMCDCPTVPDDLFKVVDECLSVIKSSAKRSADVVKDLTQMSKQGRAKLKPLALNKLPCLRECACSRDIRSSRPYITFRSILCAKPLIIMADESHLMRACSNLVHNAAESISGSGTVTVSTSMLQSGSSIHGFETIPPDNYAVLTVSDTGKGISSTDIDHVFEPFYTKKQKSERTGSGLGLSVVHGVTKDLGGFVNIESEPGRGTTISLYFPLSGEICCSNEENVDEPFLPTGSERILVVDDEVSQRYLARMSLETAGYTVTVADNGQKAVAFFEEAKKVDETDSPFDLVLLDMVMEEGYDGLVTFEKILKLFPSQRVLIASGHTSSARAKVAIELGADWLEKPYEVEDLAHAVRNRLDRQE